MVAPSFIDSQTQDSAGALALTFDMSTITHTTDDLMIAFVKQSENTGQQTWDDDGGGGNGWTRAAYNRTTSGRDQETAIYWKFATSASEPNPTFTWNTSGTTEPMSGSILVYRGVDASNPFQGPTYQAAVNDANPPNPSVTVEYINTRVVCFHAATHDDISTVAAPTGFTLRTQVWNGTADDHRNHFTADIEVDTIGSYSPPDWQHSVLNNTPEYHTYTMALNEVQPIGIDTPADNTEYVFSASNVTITGYGFEATQNTGKVELWDDIAGTTKVLQTIDSWSDTSIQIDFVQGSLTDGVRYLVVTNDTGDESRKVPLVFGFPDYEPWLVTEPDHYWPMNNAYTDEAAREGVSRPFNNVQTGTPDFVTTPLLTRSTTHSFRINQAVESSEVADSVYTNVTNTHSARNIGGWVHFVNNQLTPGTFMEEGGGVNNYYFIMEPNGRVVINIADDGDYKAQRSADFQFELGRTYHVMMSSDQAADPKVFDLWVDGEKSTAPLAGSLGTKNDMVTHSGDWTFGDADANLDTGGVDIAYAAASTMYYSHWGTWSNTGGGAPLTDDQIRNQLFRKGALSEHTISTGTESAMQTAIEAFDSQTHANVPLTYDIEDVSGGGDVELTITDQVWPDEVKFHVRWIGAGTLTIRNSGTSNVDLAKCWSPVNGTIALIDTVPVEVTVQDITDNSAIQNARVYLEAAAGGPASVGTVIVNETTDVSGLSSISYDFTSDQPVVGRVRYATGGPYYKTAGLSGTITSTGLSITALMIPDS